MTDDQIRALVSVLTVAQTSGRQVTDQVLQNAAQGLSDLLEARRLYRETEGQHDDSCNRYMGWGDTTCDCPHKDFVEALMGARPDPNQHPMTGAL